MTVDGITKLEPGFKQNVRKNFFLEGFLGKLLNQNLDKEEVIKDETACYGMCRLLRGKPSTRSQDILD